jgi:putative serine protease PepD
MPRRPRPTLVASLLAAACLGAGGGAVAYATLSDGSTAVRPVTVKQAQPVVSSTAGLSVNEIYRRANRGVVEITVTTNAGPSGFGSGGTSQAQGSGWVYDSSGHIVTNQHVVGGASSIKVRFWNGKTYSATLVGSDLSTDLAVIDVDAPASLLHPLTVGDSSQLQVGDGVVAIGSPFGLEETVTSGIASALHRTIQGPNQGFAINDTIQTDAAINHGNSGGPLLNTQGQVVGVNAQIRSDSGGNEGVGFAIPSNTVKSIAAQLISTGKAVHAYLGVSLDATAPSARIAEVRPATPAARAHLRAGDVVTAVDGRSVGTGDDLTRAIDSHRPGDTVTLKYERGGKEHTVDVKLGTRPS